MYFKKNYVQGFLEIKMKQWLRNLMTRSIAIVPSLIVSIIGGSSGAGRLIVIASVILIALSGHQFPNLLVRTLKKFNWVKRWISQFVWLMC
jgi:Mn2+/Fe2+ NRAMP family transporter